VRLIDQHHALTTVSVDLLFSGMLAVAGSSGGL
jgi:hypothetical protein